MSSEKLIATLPSTQLLNAYSLVLSATDITHRIEYISADKISIYVPASLEEKALYEIATYDSENYNWPPRQQTDDFAPLFRAMSFIIIGLLAFFYLQTGPWSDHSPWFLAGEGDSAKILQENEFYRLFTSLTLHADHVHLLSNCLLGGIVIHYFLLVVGNGIGLFAISLTGALATYINVLIHGSNHHFVGFSTAIFAVIGMLCTINSASKTKPFGHHLIMPVMSGLALLAFLGSGGERTDLGAHLFGLLTGLLVGNIARFRWFNLIRYSLAVQSSLVVCSFLIFFFSWRYALA